MASDYVMIFGSTRKVSGFDCEMIVCNVHVAIGRSSDYIPRSFVNVKENYLVPVLKLCMFH